MENLIFYTDEDGYMVGKVSFQGDTINFEVVFKDDGLIQLKNLDANISLEHFNEWDSLKN